MPIGIQEFSEKKSDIRCTAAAWKSTTIIITIGTTHFSAYGGVFVGCSNTSTTAIFTWLLMHRRNIGDTLIQGEWEIYQADHIIFAHPSPRHGVPCPMYSRSPPQWFFFFFKCGPQRVRGAGLSLLTWSMTVPTLAMYVHANQHHSWKRFVIRVRAALFVRLNSDFGRLDANSPT